MRETVQGLNKLMKDIKKLENMPQKQINKGARRGANVILKDARVRAPKDTGTLRKNIKLKAERSKKGKKVFQITFAKAERFPESVKIAKDGTRYYYPASQEWGFRTKDGGKVDGKHYLANAMVSKQGQAARVMIEEIGKEIDKALEEGSIR